MMIYNVLDYLEHTEERCGDKTGYIDAKEQYTFTQLREKAARIGSSIALREVMCSPIVIFMEKGIRNIAAFLGCLYSRNFYVPVDIKMPVQRIQLILDCLKPRFLICDEKGGHILPQLTGDFEPVFFDACLRQEEDPDKLAAVRRTMLDTDPAYILFTSGSTGTPKGVVISQRSLVDYVERLCIELKIGEDAVLGNQSPFYFDPSVIDIYCTLRMGATMCVIPPSYFTFPLKLLEYMEEKRITTIRWVPSALGIISHCDGLSKLRPSALAKVIFGSEVMPVKCYQYWKSYYPEAVFIQVYGPTEITGTCTYYVVEGDYADTDRIPIGTAYYNTNVFLLDEMDRPVQGEEPGEICVKGSCVGLGYYNDREKTDAAFMQNPLNQLYREYIYRTGDLGRYNGRGELIFLSRKDYQIKHMGYRIELGEIESVIHSCAGIQACCCVYDPGEDIIGLYYAGGAMAEDQIAAELKERLPRYMQPGRILRLDAMPLTPSGKTDRKYLAEQFAKTIRANG